MLQRFIVRTLRIQLIAWGFAFLFLFSLLLLGAGFVSTIFFPYINCLIYFLAIASAALLAVFMLALKYEIRLLRSIEHKFVKSTNLSEVMLHVSILVGILGFYLGMGRAS